MEDVPIGAAVSQLNPTPSAPPPIDPITALKLQIEEAKSDKVHDFVCVYSWISCELVLVLHLDYFIGATVLYDVYVCAVSHRLIVIRKKYNIHVQCHVHVPYESSL